LRSNNFLLSAVALLVAPLLVTCAGGGERADRAAERQALVLRGARAGIGGVFATEKSDLSSCPSGMTLVSGSYCPEVEQTCLRWLDPPGRYRQFRCAEYAAPSTCKGKRRLMRFCIDTDEQRAAGVDPRPRNRVSFYDTKLACAARGARVCNESEWTFACEGEEMRPYPYGFVRDSEACNIDHFDLGSPGAGLRDHRTAIGANPRCSSPFGVRDLAGNLEEWVTRDDSAPGSTSWTKPTLLKGSWWLPGKSTCRAVNAGHNGAYWGPETGYRCCL
jgi:hypothetical protein